MPFTPQSLLVLDSVSIIFVLWQFVPTIELALLIEDAREMAHPDLRWVKPDGAEIKVDAIREVGPHNHFG